MVLSKLRHTCDADLDTSQIGNGYQNFMKGRNDKILINWMFPIHIVISVSLDSSSRAQIDAKSKTAMFLTFVHQSTVFQQRLVSQMSCHWADTRFWKNMHNSFFENFWMYLQGTSFVDELITRWVTIGFEEKSDNGDTTKVTIKTWERHRPGLFFYAFNKFFGKNSIHNVDVVQKDVDFGRVFNSWNIIQTKALEFGYMDIFNVL